MLEAENIQVFYGAVRALKHVSFHVDQGRIISVIGANGAGKSTLLKAVAGVVPPTEGHIRFEGQSIKGLSATAIVKKGISLVPEGRQLFTSLSVVDNLTLGAYLHYRRKGREEITSRLEEVYTLFPILKERSVQIAGTLSGGEQQMVSIGRALMSQPSLLMLDEPSMGLAPLVIAEIMQTIVRLNREGTSITLVEQNARAALRISRYAYVLENGRVVREGKSDELLSDPTIIGDYLGGV
ncbi:MAG: ABC transporter ATP-binding protein [Deltaproteobacteria bacterium]|nr:ABC transporter ATP-binding protein [Deltaproteobacteria bacterium]